MAESSINVTEGSGKRLHTVDKTISSVLVQDQVVLLGHPYEAAYSISAGVLSTLSTINSHLFQIMAGSTNHVYVHRITGYLSAVAGAATLMQFKLMRLTTAGTGGSANSVNQLDPSVSAASATSRANITSSLGAEGAAVADCMAIIPASTAELRPIIFDFDFSDPHIGALKIAAGASNGVAVKNLSSLATATILVVATITETTY